MKCSLIFFVGWVATFLLSAGVASHAAVDQSQDAIFAFTEENDTYGNPPGPHQDRHYTQGLKFTYRASDDDFRNATPALSAALPVFAIDPSAADLGFVFGQNMYTPTDLKLKNPNPLDRPYAGWLYGGVFLQRRGVTAGSIPVLENFEANVGFIGPGSLAGTIQTSFHTSIGVTVPQGWGHQLKTEPGLDLKYARLWRLSMSPESARYFDFIPYVGGNVGNILVAGNIGGALRFGWNLPCDFGIPINDSPYNANGGLTADAPPFFVYGFSRVEGRVVGHNIFLDGSSFRDGPHVERQLFVADLSLGAAMRLFRHLELSYMHVVRTSEFVHQANKDQFGSFTVKALFSF